MAEPDSTTTTVEPVDTTTDTDTTATTTEPATNGASTYDADAAQAKIKKVNAEAQNLRTRLKAAEEKAAKLDEIENANKSDTQKLTDQLAKAQNERDELAAKNTRFLAAAEFDVPVDLIDLLGSGTEDEIRARAQLLAEKLKPAPANGNANGRPVESLTPGAAPKSNEDKSDPNAWIRRMAGRE